MRIKGECVATASSFKFVPFVPISSSSSTPTPALFLPLSCSLLAASPKDGENFNDSSEDSGGLIGKCDCHSDNVGLFRPRGGEMKADRGEKGEGSKKRKKILALFKQKKWTWVFAFIKPHWPSSSSSPVRSLAPAAHHFGFKASSQWRDKRLDWVRHNVDTQLQKSSSGSYHS